MKEILEEIKLANNYLEAMKKTMLNDKGDCDNVQMHLIKINSLVKTLNLRFVSGSALTKAEIATIKILCNDKQTGLSKMTMLYHELEHILDKLNKLS